MVRERERERSAHESELLGTIIQRVMVTFPLTILKTSVQL